VTAKMERRTFITLLGGGRRVAARGARAAGGDAGDRIFKPWIAGVRCSLWDSEMLALADEVIE